MPRQFGEAMPSNIVLRNLSSPPRKSANPLISTKPGRRLGDRSPINPPSGNQPISATIANGKITVLTDGTHDFGNTGPIPLMLASTDAATGFLRASDIRVGEGVNLDLTTPDLFEIVNDSTMPFGKGWKIGGTEGGQNPTLTERIWVDYPSHKRIFESRVTYWPATQQANALPLLDANATWGMKPIWNMADRHYGQDKTNFFWGSNYGWSSSSELFSSNSAISTNLIGQTVYFSGNNQDPADSLKRPYADPFIISTLWDQGSNDGVTADGQVKTLSTRVNQGQSYLEERTDLVLSEIGGDVDRFNSFSYPGYIRGFGLQDNAHMLEAEIYKAAGPGAACMVVISDNADFKQATKYTIQWVTNWENFRIEADLRAGWFDLASREGLFVNIVGADFEQIASVSIAPQAAPEITSAIDNGDGTITINGANFGAKQQAAPLLYDHTDSVWENGVEETRQAAFADGQVIESGDTDPDSLWQKNAKPAPGDIAMSIARSRALRHPGATAHYYGTGSDAFLGWPRATGGEANNVVGDRAYVAFWIKLPFNMSRYWAIPADANTANFITGDDYDYGEDILIDGLSEPARVIRYYPNLGAHQHGWLFVEMPDEVVNWNPIMGKTMTGVQSGTTLVIPTYGSDAAFDGDGYISPRGKYLRMWSDSDGKGWRYSTANMGMASSAGTLWTNKFGSKYPIPQQWNLIEVFVDKGQAEPRYTALLNGEIYLDDDEAFKEAVRNYQVESSPEKLTTIALIGANDFMSVPFSVDLADIYMDQTYQRVYLADAPTWDQVNHRELQRPKQWSDEQIIISKFDGALTGNKWLYVVGPNDQINSEGVAI